MYLSLEKVINLTKKKKKKNVKLEILSNNSLVGNLSCRIYICHNSITTFIEFYHGNQFQKQESINQVRFQNFVCLFVIILLPYVSYKSACFCFIAKKSVLNECFDTSDRRFRTKADIPHRARINLNKKLSPQRIPNCTKLKPSARSVNFEMYFQFSQKPNLKNSTFLCVFGEN